MQLGDNVAALEDKIAQALGKDVIWIICLKPPSPLPWAAPSTPFQPPALHPQDPIADL